MAEEIKKLGSFVFASKAFWIAAALAAVAFFLGYFSPPVGDVPDWTFKTIAWCFAFAVLGFAINAVKEGMDLSYEKGDTKITIKND